MSTLSAPSLSIGIEEECLLVTIKRLALVSELMCHIAVNTPVCSTVAGVGYELCALRNTLHERTAHGSDRVCLSPVGGRGHPTRAIAAALYQCLVYWLYQLQERNLHLRDYSAMLIAENRSQGLVK